ncbi:MAG: CapA family protein [Chloroflexi bacterium]|nr:CapA family protein [Chloroflexota bacterium]
MSPKTTTMALVGDTYLKTDNPASFFRSTDAYLGAADIAFGNLEAPISDRGTLREGKASGFRSEPRMVEGLKAGGFSAVGMANNHSMDYGGQALLDTVDILDEAKIGHTGGGRNIAEAHLPAVVTANGASVAFLSYASVFWPTYAAEEDRPGIAVVRVATAYQPGGRVFEQPASPPIVITIPNAADLDAVRRDIERAREKADIVVISWHWGVSEGFRTMVPYQVEFGHFAVDAGADVVIGHHPHVLQAVEVYKGKVIAYSMGNFAFPYASANYDVESIILRFQIQDKRIKRVSFVPVLQNSDLRPEVLDVKNRQKLVDKMQQLSAGFGTRFDASGDEVMVVV